jgi:hypothetical protein
MIKNYNEFINEMTLKDIPVYYKIWRDLERTRGRNTLFSCIFPKTSKKLKKFKKIKKIKNPELDPYGEENWNNENKLYEFVNINDTYPYKFIKEEPNPLRDEYDFIYEFKSTTGEVYNVALGYTKDYDDERYMKLDDVVSIDWADQKQFYANREIYAAYKPMKSINQININDMHRILNTVFKIFLDFLSEYSMKYVLIGSYTRHKFKAYKKIFQELSNDKYKFTIIEENSDPDEVGIYYRLAIKIDYLS